MIKVEDIYPLTDFQREAKSHLRSLKTTGRPVLLTVNGKAAVVVQDAAAYQAMLEVVDRAEAIIGIQRGLDSVARGEGKPAAEVIGQIRAKHHLVNRE